MTLSPMEGCLRCPSCQQAPDMTIGNTAFDFNFTIRCLQKNHDHVAGGDTLESAINNWNLYVKGLITTCPEIVRKPNETKTEKAINDAMFEIDPKEEK